VSLNVCVFMYIYICVCVGVYTHIHTHTHTHTYFVAGPLGLAHIDGLVACILYVLEQINVGSIP